MISRDFGAYMPEIDVVRAPKACSMPAGCQALGMKHRKKQRRKPRSTMSSASAPEAWPDVLAARQMWPISP